MRSWSFLLPFLAIMLLLSLGACIEEQEDLSKVSNLPPQLAQVKQWFEANKEQLRIRDGGASFRTESQELILPFFEKEPNWQQVHQYAFPDGREVFEIGLANAEKYFPAYLKDSLQTKDPAGAVIQNIMFVKNPETGRFDPLIARYYPDNETSIREFGDIHYNDIPLGWSGLVDIWTYDERFYVAFAIEDGEITRVFQRVQDEMENGRKKTIGKNYDVTCQYYQVTYLAYTVSAGGITREHLEYGIVYECSGGSLPTGPTPVIYSYGPTSSPSGNYGGVGGSTPIYGSVTYAPPPIPAPAPIKKLNCSELRNSHGQSAKGIWEFRNQYYGKTYDQIINTESPKNIQGLGSQPGGPGNTLQNGFFRYIQDPLNPNIIIDMRHLLVIGKYGRAIGESVEFLQWLDGQESAYDHQDFYSNELGYSFFAEFGSAVSHNPSATVDYLITFLHDKNFRNSVSSPERCK